MARYYKYKRAYVKRLYPRKRWASNVVTKNTLVTLPSGSKSAFITEELVINSRQGTTPTPVLIKFGRVKVKGDVRTDLASDNNYVSGVMYVIYVPQSLPINDDIITDHPEYIIGWTTISLDSGNSFSFSSSLKRNLNSGDKVVLFFQVNSVNSTSNARNFNFYYTAQYWTTSA